MTTEDLDSMVGAAQRAAGILAARHRGDPEGVRHLLQSFANERALAGGSLLLAELALSILSAETDQTFEECVRRLSVDLERAVVTRE